MASPSATHLRSSHMQRAEKGSGIMDALDGMGLLRRLVGRRTPSVRPASGGRRVPLIAAVAALTALALIASASGPAARASVAAAATAPTDFPGLVLPAQLAVLQAELSAPGGAAGDGFGVPVAIDGNTVLVGAPLRDTAAGADAGTAYIFTRSGASWTLQAELTASDSAAGDNFGGRIALAGDTALIGAEHHDVGSEGDAGVAYVFVRSGSAWTLQAELTDPSPAAGDLFGTGALSGDTALVASGYHDTAAGADAGAVYVFVRSGSAWTLQATLTAADSAAGDLFGGVKQGSLSGDTAIVCAQHHDPGGVNNAGAAFVFVRSGTTWAQQAELTAPDAHVHDLFGGTGAVLSGDTALVSAVGYDTANGADAGAAFVFVRSGTTWTQQAELTAPDSAAGDWFSGGISISGERALISAPYHDSAGNTDVGAAYLFGRSGAIWSQVQEITAPEPAADEHFAAVALDSGTAVVGAPGHDTAGKLDAGAAWVYTLDDGAPVTTASLAPPPNAAGWCVAPVTLILTAVDADSGVASTEYRLQGTTAWTLCTAPIVLSAPGVLVYEYRSTDTVGNVEATKTITVRIAAQPTIARLTPRSARRGALVVVSGSGFGDARGDSVVRFGGKKCASYLSWSDTSITCKVPGAAPVRKVRVTVTTAAGTSNAKSFVVKR